MYETSILFSRANKKNMINLLSAETAQKMLKVKTISAKHRVYKTFFMLSSTEQEISLGHKNKNTKQLKLFSSSADLSMKEVLKKLTVF